MLLENIDAEIIKHIRNNDVFSSCSPSRKSIQKDKVGLGGQATVSPSGHALAVSYFTTYKRPMVDNIMTKYKVDFRRYRTREEIATEALERIPERNFKGQSFDTGKVLSLLISLDGGEVTHYNFESLVHFGGLSKNRKRAVGANDKKCVRENHRIREFYYELFDAVDNGLPMPPIVLEDQASENNVSRIAQKAYQVCLDLKKNYPDL